MGRNIIYRSRIKCKKKKTILVFLNVKSFGSDQSLMHKLLLLQQTNRPHNENSVTRMAWNFSYFKLSSKGTLFWQQNQPLWLSIMDLWQHCSSLASKKTITLHAWATSVQKIKPSCLLAEFPLLNLTPWCTINARDQCLAPAEPNIFRPPRR